MTWLHRESRGSLLLAGFAAHGAMNAAHTYLGEAGLDVRLMLGGTLMVGVGLVVVLADRAWWFSTPTLGLSVGNRKDTEATCL
jgi:hypothetical protein